MRMRTAVWILVLAGMFSGAAVATDQPASKPVDVRDLMTVHQFDQAGLNKLSPEEINVLNAWLNGYLQTRASIAPTGSPAPQSSPALALPAAAAASAANFGASSLPARIQEPERIETRVAGLFNGWTGETVFALENGQVWKQSGTGYFTDVKLDHPQVVIKKLTFGYLLTLPGYSETVFVRRIK